LLNENLERMLQERSEEIAPAPALCFSDILFVKFALGCWNPKRHLDNRINKKMTDLVRHLYHYYNGFGKKKFPSNPLMIMAFGFREEGRLKHRFPGRQWSPVTLKPLPLFSFVAK
jgi:hypothetical protein